jgi:hypothetical protein
VFNAVADALSIQPNFTAALDSALTDLALLPDPATLAWEADYAQTLAAIIQGGEPLIAQIGANLIPPALPPAPRIIPAHISVINPAPGPTNQPFPPISYPPGLPPDSGPPGTGECGGQPCVGPGPGSGPPVLNDCTGAGPCVPITPPVDTTGGQPPTDGGGGTAPGGVGAPPGPIGPPPVDTGGGGDGGIPPVDNFPPPSGGGGDSGGGGGVSPGSGGETGSSDF